MALSSRQAPLSSRIFRRTRLRPGFRQSPSRIGSRRFPMSVMPPASMQEFVQRVAQYGKTEFHLALRFGDYDLAVASNSAAMIEKLRHIFRHFLDDAPTSR